MRWLSADAWAGRAARWGAGSTDALLGQRLQVLMFHRVLARPDPLFPAEMHAARFDGLLGIVARAFAVLTLGQALTLLAQRRLPRRALVITFDDGYADNAELALPLLLRHGLRATFFVSTGFLDGGRMWNDSIIETLRLSALPAVDLSEFGLGAMTLAAPEQRRRAIEALLPKVKYMALPARQQALDRLRQLAGAPPLPAGPMMTTAQVQQLQRSGMEIGGHTVRHPILALLPDAEARAEIADGQAQLQARVDAPIDVFAYPNGQPGRDFDARHVDMLRQLGFRGAVTTAAGTAGVAADPFRLPRFTPWDVPQWRWTARLLSRRLVPAAAEPSLA